MTVCVHLCRGNAGHRQPSGGYDTVAERLFQNADEAGFFLEYNTDGSDDFSALRPLATDNLAVLRLMSTKLRELEPADESGGASTRPAVTFDLDRASNACVI
jgi:5-methyltetrahydropteroyltriglutamate--homocysteine methyltransferase